MTSTQAAARARMRPGIDPWSIVRLVAVAVVLVFVVFGVPTLLRGPGFVDHVTVVNPTAMAVEVSVAKPGSDAPVGVGYIPARSRVTFDDVVDMGDRWDVRVVANGGAEIATTIPRTDLSDHDWTFRVSDQLGSQLSRDGGITEPRD